jgi:hypothetical protein
MLIARFGRPRRLGPALPAGWVAAFGRRLLATSWFTRRVAIEGWFLHSRQPPLAVTTRRTGGDRRKILT